MQLSIVANERGVTERRFDLEVGDSIVPGLLWTPEGARGPRPLVLIGHGGTQHKRVDTILSMARRLVRRQGYAALAIDAPGHGDRLRPEDAAEQQRTRAALQSGAGLPFTPERMRGATERVVQVTAEWKAALDAVEALEGIERGPVGYWGVSMGSVFGVPFVAAEPRVKAAVFGLLGLRPGAQAQERAANSIRIPILFMYQLNDELMPLETGLALFNAFGSKVKSMHINPGAHVALPLFERDSYEAFFVRHLGRSATTPPA